MNRFVAVLLVIGLGAASLPAAAMDVAQGARFGLGLGRWSDDAKTHLTDVTTNTDLGNSDSTNVRLTYGGEVGYTLTLGDFYSDVGLNLLRVKFEESQNWRTDLLFTVGYYINDNWSVFAGIRRGWQGDGVFKDDVFNEFGPYAGVGFGGLPLGGWGILNTSFAYNFDKVRDFPLDGTDFSYPGVSVKLGLNFKGTPHSLQLRLQRFSGDGSVDGQLDNGDTGRFDFKLTETWAVLSYVFTLAW
jgi:hypothetical protein